MRPPRPIARPKPKRRKRTAAEQEEFEHGKAAGLQGLTHSGRYLGGPDYTAAWNTGNTMGLLRRLVANPDDEVTLKVLRGRRQLIEGPCDPLYLATHDLA